MNPTTASASQATRATALATPAPIAWALFIATTLAVTALSALTAAPAAAQSTAPACVVGEAIQVEWGGSWYPSHIVSGPDAQGRCLITYDGWSSSWDEWVGGNRMRGYTAEAPACPVGEPLDVAWLAGKPYVAEIVGGPDEGGQCLVAFRGWGHEWFEWAVLEVIEPPTLLCNPGQALSVEWNGQWYDATALSGSDEACLITYDGWSSSWDETVGMSRMRPRGAELAQAVTPAAEAKPPARYRASEPQLAHHHPIRRGRGAPGRGR